MTAYAELHCKTNFSFLEGASHAEELAATVRTLGYRALAVTDRDSLAGVVRAHVAAKEQGIKLIVGAELHFNDAPPVVVWAPDRRTYGRLCRLITAGRRRAEKGSCDLSFADLAAHADGLIAGVILSPEGATQLSPGREREPWVTGTQNPLSPEGATQPVPCCVAPSGLRSFLGPGTNAAPSGLRQFRDLFGDRAYLLAELFRGPDDARRLDELQRLSRETGLPLLAANDVHYHSPARLPLHDVLTAIRTGATVATAGDALFLNAERHLRPMDEIVAAFAAASDAIARTIEVADRCTFTLDELRYEYPEELVPAGRTPAEYLAELTWKGATERYPGGIPDEIRRLVEHELVLIRELQYEAYFLTVHDLVRFAKSKEILCQGRGSAANSAVCFCLGVTSVDPDRIDVLFERFVSKERAEAPDIDIDFEHERREEVLQYLYEKYGRERAGLAATVITYCVRSAVRDVGKALGLSLDRVDALAKQVEGYHTETLLDARCAAVGIDPTSPVGKRLIYLVNEILGFPRHLSQHVGGMILTQGPLCEVVPIENAAMEDRTVVQWDKNDLDALGILKVDVLALGMLTAIRKCFKLVERHHGRPLTLATVPAEDPAVYEMCQEADTIGVFQIESRGQMSMLPRLKPKEFYDLVIEVAIVRPGPIQGKMVHPYLRRRNGEELPVYPNEEIRAVLKKTLGVPLFQEQAMRLAVVAAGFTPGEADQLRRAMGAWRRSGVIEQFRARLLAGMTARGLTAEFADQVFQMIRGFGEYGFPESHAASFALLVYVSAWLKRYYPACFAAGLLNSQPMGFYAPAQIVGDARKHGVPVRPVDVNFSEWNCTLEPCVSPEGAVQLSPGREPWVCGPGKIPSPEGATQSVPCCVAPSGLRVWEAGDTQGSRPGLTCAASSGLIPISVPIPPSEWGKGQRAFRLGFRLVGGLREGAADAIVAARADGPFQSVSDLARRARLGRATLEILADADALGSLELDRRAALWQSLGQDRRHTDSTLFAGLVDDEPAADLPVLSPPEQVFADYRATGMSLKGHPIQFCRGDLDRLRVVPAAKLVEMDHGQRLSVAGIVLVRQRPSTAKGITFVTLEDETGVANLVIRQDTWERYYQVARRSAAWVARGMLERKDKIIHILVQRLDDLSKALGGLRTKSRDFC
jgi:error-prone DNA polymerase